MLVDPNKPTQQEMLEARLRDMKATLAASLAQSLLAQGASTLSNVRVEDLEFMAGNISQFCCSVAEHIIERYKPRDPGLRMN